MAQNSEKVPEMSARWHNFLSKLPKVELHAHLNGSVNEEMMKELIARKKKKGPAWKMTSVQETAVGKGSRKTLDEVFAIFALIHEIIDDTEAAYLVAKDVIKNFAAENVKYLELRTTPRHISSTTMTKRSHIGAVIKAIRDATNELELDIVVRILLSIDRTKSVKEARDTVALAAEFKNLTDGLVVGVDFSGDPNKGDGRDFIPVFKEARDLGLKLSLHMGEVADKNEEIEAMLGFVPDRIGHGTFIHPDKGGTDEHIKTIEKHKIPIEFCLSSNYQCLTVTNHKDHHFKYWWDRNHPCIIATDDCGVFGVSLTDEFILVAETFDLDLNPLWNLSYKAIDYIFGDEAVKRALKQKFNAVKWALLSEVNKD